MRYLRLWRQFAVMSFVREAEYRVNFLLGVGEGAAQLALPVVTFLLIYRFTPRVAGWSQAQVLLLIVGIALATVALILTHLFWSYAVHYYSSASS